MYICVYTHTHTLNLVTGNGLLAARGRVACVTDGAVARKIVQVLFTTRNILMWYQTYISPGPVYHTQHIDVVQEIYYISCPQDCPGPVYHTQHINVVQDIY